MLFRVFKIRRQCSCVVLILSIPVCVGAGSNKTRTRLTPFTVSELTVGPKFVLVRADIDPGRVIDWVQKINYHDSQALSCLGVLVLMR